MYTISAAEALKFVTTGYIPVKQIRDANAYGNTGTAGGLGTGGVKNDGSDQATIEYNTVDGALIGGASLKSDDFWGICESLL